MTSPQIDPEDASIEAILDLAALIREVDGSHTLGAAALSEAILSHPDFGRVVTYFSISGACK